MPEFPIGLGLCEIMNTVQLTLLRIYLGYLPISTLE
jgi:hypothetical protein